MDEDRKFSVNAHACTVFSNGSSFRFLNQIWDLKNIFLKIYLQPDIKQSDFTVKCTDCKKKQCKSTKSPFHLRQLEGKGETFTFISPKAGVAIETNTFFINIFSRKSLTLQYACFPESSRDPEQDVGSSAPMWLSCSEPATILRHMRFCTLVKASQTLSQLLDFTWSDFINLCCSLYTN